MPVVIRTSVEIARPPEEVFAYLTDLRNAKEWSTEIVDVEYGGDLAQGATGVDEVRFRKVKEILESRA